MNSSAYYQTKSRKTALDSTNNNAYSTQRKHKEYATKGTSDKERSSRVRTRKVSNNREYIKGSKEDEAVVENYSNSKGFQFPTQNKTNRLKNKVAYNNVEEIELGTNDNHQRMFRHPDPDYFDSSPTPSPVGNQYREHRIYGKLTKTPVIKTKIVPRVLFHKPSKIKRLVRRILHPVSDAKKQAIELRREVRLHKKRNNPNDEIDIIY